MKFLFCNILFLIVCLVGCKKASSDRCGDGVLDPGEECDRNELSVSNCYELGYYDQVDVLSCKKDCTLDRSVCGARCGDGYVQVVHGEQCDGQNVNGLTCEDLELGTGILHCQPNCRFDTSGCEIHAVCGDGVVAAPYEKCEQDNLNTETCLSLGYHGGQLACAHDCLSFDVQDCVAHGRCGDGELQMEESCDGDQLNQETCLTLGFLRGTLSCSETCTFDTSLCENESDNADLASLSVVDGVLSPLFDPQTVNYMAQIPSHQTHFNVLAQAAHSAAQLVFDPPDPLQIAIEDQPVMVSVTVTAELGNQKVYTVTVNRITSPDLDTPFLGTMRYVPPGTFQRNEIPGDLATVSAFYIGVHEITRAQFLDVLERDPSHLFGTNSMDQPVQKVNWYDTLVFCNTLSIREGLTPVYSVNGSSNPWDWGDVPAQQDDNWDAVEANWNADGYRLPTVMEWLWAAMGATDQTDGHAKPFAGSDGINSVDDCAWYRENCSFQTQPVGTKFPNELNLYDMSGNVSEWVWDWHTPGYPNGELVDHRGPTSGQSRAKRGGSFWDLADALMLDIMDNIHPNEQDNRNGFRVVRRL